MQHHIQLGQFPLHTPCHACAFFHDLEEEYELLLPFFREGYDAGDRLFHVADKTHHGERLQRLTDSGIDLESAKSNGQLAVRAWEDAYIRDNHFNKHRMLELIQARRAGDRRIRDAAE